MAHLPRSWPSRRRDPRRGAAGYLVGVLLIGVVSACTSKEDSEPNTAPSTGPAASPPGASPSTAAPAPSSTPTPTTDAQRVRALLRDPAPRADEVISVAKAPRAWTRARDRLLVQYGVAGPFLGSDAVELAAVQVLDRRGRVRGEWVEGGAGQAARDYWPVGRQRFAGLPQWDEGSGTVKPVLVRDGTLVPLTRVNRPRPARPVDVRFGHGWLLDQAARTITPERRDSCRRDSIRTDVDGGTWCLGLGKQRMYWTHDRGRTWQSHDLSTSYLGFCDGGGRGTDLAVQGDVVAIGLWRADFSFDAGATWQDVSLPYELVGGNPDGIVTSNCTTVVPLPDGRLAISHYKMAVATDPTNTRFELLQLPRGTEFAYVDEGVIVAPPRRRFGDRYVSYDGGTTWQVPRARSLVRHLIPDQ
jgi:hypothetical protein